MSIEEKLVYLNNWIESNDILLITPSLINSDNKFERIDFDSFEMFLKTVLKLDGKIIICNSLLFDDFYSIKDDILKIEELIALDEEEINEEIKEFEEGITDDEDDDDDEIDFDIEEEQEEFKEIKECFALLEPFIGKYLSCNLYFIDNGVFYSYKNSIENIEYYYNTKDFIKSFWADDYPKKSFKYSVHKMLTQKQIEKFGIILATHKHYAILKNRTQREHLANRIFDEALIKLNIVARREPSISSIVTEAEMYFEIEMREEIENEMRKKIKKMHSNGLTKVKMASELGVTMGVINKYL